MNYPRELNELSKSHTVYTFSYPTSNKHCNSARKKTHLGDMEKNLLTVYAFLCSYSPEIKH